MVSLEHERFGGWRRFEKGNPSDRSCDAPARVIKSSLARLTACVSNLVYPRENK